MRPEHWPEVERVYAAGIATGHATFETEPPTWERFDRTRLGDQRFVALDEGDRVAGWGRGIGLGLLQALIASTEAAGIRTIQSGIFPENTTSLRLHERAGFRVVGTRQRVGHMAYGPMAGRWRDVILVERRSDTAGA